MLKIDIGRVGIGNIAPIRTPPEGGKEGGHTSFLSCVFDLLTSSMAPRMDFWVSHGIFDLTECWESLWQAWRSCVLLREMMQ